jgi:hypothetical protein
MAIAQLEATIGPAHASTVQARQLLVTNTATAPARR